MEIQKGLKLQYEIYTPTKPTKNNLQQENLTIKNMKDICEGLSKSKTVTLEFLVIKDMKDVCEGITKGKELVFDNFEIAHGNVNTIRHIVDEKHYSNIIDGDHSHYSIYRNNDIDNQLYSIYLNQESLEPGTILRISSIVAGDLISNVFESKETGIISMADLIVEIYFSLKSTIPPEQT
jgi:hypothetical protein